MKIVPHICLAVLICAALLTLSRNTDWIHSAPAAPADSFALDRHVTSADRSISESDMEPMFSFVSLADLHRRTAAAEDGLHNADIVTLACRGQFENPNAAKTDNQIFVTAVREVWVE